jgi:hypothetical protein
MTKIREKFYVIFRRKHQNFQKKSFLLWFLPKKKAVLLWFFGVFKFHVVPPMKFFGNRGKFTLKPPKKKSKRLRFFPSKTHFSCFRFLYKISISVRCKNYMKLIFYQNRNLFKMPYGQLS